MWVRPPPCMCMNIEQDRIKAMQMWLIKLANIQISEKNELLDTNQCRRRCCYAIETANFKYIQQKKRAIVIRFMCYISRLAYG